jgi:hypothetical protein
MDCGTEIPDEYATGYIVETEGPTLLDSIRAVTCDTEAGFDGNPAAIVCSADGWTPVNDGGSYSFCTSEGSEGSQEVPLSSVAETFMFQSSAPVVCHMQSLLTMLVTDLSTWQDAPMWWLAHHGAGNTHNGAWSLTDHGGMFERMLLTRMLNASKCWLRI